MKDYIRAFIDTLVAARTDVPGPPLSDRPEGRWLSLAAQGRITRVRLAAPPAPAREISARVSRAERAVRAGN